MSRPEVQEMREAVEKAVELLGGQAATARAVGVTDKAVAKWRARRVPAERVLELERLTERRVTRYELRPDLYPREG